MLNCEDHSALDDNPYDGQEMHSAPRNPVNTCCYRRPMLSYNSPRDDACCEYALGDIEWIDDVQNGYSNTEGESVIVLVPDEES